MKKKDENETRHEDGIKRPDEPTKEENHQKVKTSHDERQEEPIDRGKSRTKLKKEG